MKKQKSAVTGELSVELYCCTNDSGGETEDDNTDIAIETFQ